jgi:hypothetical protein
MPLFGKRMDSHTVAYNVGNATVRVRE